VPNATRDLLVAEGFGVLTEIDMQAMLQVGVDISPEGDPRGLPTATGPCCAAGEPSTGLLPCNVLVRRVDGDRTG
jgi:hypothetical protein